MSERSITPFSLQRGIDSVTYLRESQKNAVLPALAAHTPSPRRRESHLSVLLKKPTPEDAIRAFLEPRCIHAGPGTPDSLARRLTLAGQACAAMAQEPGTDQESLRRAAVILAMDGENRGLLFAALYKFLQG